MATSWYYDYYEKGSFPHQQKLCEAVEWTKCNLEGRKLVPTTLIKPDGTETRTCKLTGQTANPLTIRLLALREALNKLESSINPLSEIIRTQAQKQFDKGKMFEMGGTYITKSDGYKAGGAPVEIIEIKGKRKPIELHHDTIHLAIYEFFANFGSAMDRLAYEIKLLYALPIPLVDWPKLTKMKQGKYENLKDLNSKDAELTRFIKSHKSKFIKALGYRNRLVHDGIIRVEPKISISRVGVMLADDPDDDESSMSVNAIEFCKEIKSSLLKLLDGSYELMLQHLQTHGKPPW